MTYIVINKSADQQLYAIGIFKNHNNAVGKAFTVMQEYLEDCDDGTANIEPLKVMVNSEGEVMLGHGRINNKPVTFNIDILFFNEKGLEFDE